MQKPQIQRAQKEQSNQRVGHSGSCIKHSWSKYLGLKQTSAVPPLKVVVFLTFLAFFSNWTLAHLSPNLFPKRIMTIQRAEKEKLSEIFSLDLATAGERKWRGKPTHSDMEIFDKSATKNV